MIGLISLKPNDMKAVILLIILSICSLQSFAQEEEKDSTETVQKKYYLVKKIDGGEFYGYILKDDGREILLETKTIGKIYINKSEIAEIIEVKEADVVIEPVKYGDYRETGVFTTRYYFTTNALPIKKKENYAMIHLYGPEVHFAVSDNLSLGIMASWIASPIALAAKYSFDSESNTHVALGSIVGSSGYLFNAKGVGGLHWLTVTQGNRKSNISFSAGFGYLKTGLEKYYGDKYLYQTYEPNDPYYVPYDAGEELGEQLYGSNYSNYQFRESPLNKALVLGVSGITPVGKKSSFIFDSMIFFSRPKEVVYTDKDVVVNYVDNSSAVPVSYVGSFTIGEGALVETNSVTTNILLMPGMRFNQAYNKAIQVTLSGIINIDGSGNVQTIPIPMVSWLRQF